MPRKSTSKWDFTRVPNLLRNTKTGIYYSRPTIGGKKLWKSHATTDYKTAQLRHAEFMRQVGKAESSGTPLVTGKMTMGELVEQHLRFVDETTEMKESAKRYRRNSIQRIRKTWPDFETKNVRSFTVAEIEAWHLRFRKTYSISSANGCISALRALFAAAQKSGIRADNPAEELPLRSLPVRDLSFPTIEEYERMCLHIREKGRWQSWPASCLALGLAYTGMRVGETHWLRWKHVDWENNLLEVVGDPVEGTKAGRAVDGSKGKRFVPIIPKMRTLLEQMFSRYDGNAEGFVFGIKTCLWSLRNACDEFGFQRLDHHALRHYFITACIEAGVEIPIIAVAVGHKDGGALLMKRYSHIAIKRNTAQFNKVFSGAMPAGGFTLLPPPNLPFSVVAEPASA